MSGGLITHNEARDGAGINYECDFVLSGTAEISHNIASGDGGGIYICMDGDCFEMTGGTISNNMATGNGGGIYVGMDAEMEISGGSFTANTANIGGAIHYSTSGSLLISGYAEFHYNEAEDCGGALYIENCPSAEINASEFAYNKAQYGGAIYTLAELTISKTPGEDLIFSNNENITTGITPDPSADIYAQEVLYLGGEISFNADGAVLLASPSAGIGSPPIVIVASHRRAGEGCPIYLGSDFGWETGMPIITLSPGATAAGVSLSSETDWFWLVSGSVGTGIDENGYLE
jgi:parallel beta-helix repeat protein/predicted outer membrane repeat protein